jgi:hypothetical protein
MMLFIAGGFLSASNNQLPEILRAAPVGLGGEEIMQARGSWLFKLNAIKQLNRVQVVLTRIINYPDHAPGIHGGDKLV